MPFGDFTQQADAYHRSRPPYPAALVDQLVARAGLAPGDLVADVGAGTGIMSAHLAERGFVVHAIEPTEAMRDYIASHERVSVRDGTFEATGLPDGAVRWVIAAQAFHWADPPRALPELWRIIAPGGTFAVVWNNRRNQDSPIVAWTREAIARIVPDFDHAYRDTDWAKVVTAGSWFTDVVYDELDQEVVMSRARYLDLWRGHNRLNNIAGPARFAQLMKELEAHLDQQRVTEVSVPYRAKAWTARRSAQPGQ